ncbi:hypothetical protein [Thiocapsa roseopersicina]|uniref:hypothetical protein n=1 Tax=Thiocapsa roseopersicina TaxID=1058 RepID=UPI000B807A09|nr:hypothetical protein [Thiocapsa roseopersicina]
MRISFVRDGNEIWYYDIAEERTVGIETHLLLPGEMKVSVLSKAWEEWSSRWRKTYVLEDGMRKSHAAFCSMVTQGDGALVPVAVVGTSEKSIRVRVKAELYSFWVDKEITEHTITVPRSMLVEHEGTTYFPRWMIKRTLRERITKGKAWPKVIGSGVWLDAPLFWERCFRPALDIWATHEESNKKAIEEQQQRRRQAQARTAPQRPEPPQPPKVEVPPAYRRLPMVQASGVEYDDWVSVGSGRNKKRKKVVIEVGCAKLFFSEKQVVIETPAGKSIRKARTNVRFASELTQ